MEQLGFIDWDAAVKTGGALVPPGPALPADEIAAVVASLHGAADAANEHVAAVTGLPTPPDARVLVVDRPSWIAACARGTRAILGDVGAAAGDGVLARLSGGVQGGGLGAMLAAISTRVLGQFEPFASPATLLLVAPNIVAVERDLGADAADFRLWVCVHEQTHRFQFGRAPWLRDHLIGLMAQMLDAEEIVSLRQLAQGDSLLDRFLTPAQREVFDQTTAVMSLVEGYADVMMDRVGTDVIATLPAIRAAFERRRDRGGWSAVVGKLIGADLKLAQYREGAAFCQAVLDRAGLDGLNAAWESADTLPRLDELRDPGLWMARVCS